jgi:hypothetical protein
VADDIVIGNVKYRRISGEWMMTPRGTRGMFHIDPRRRELLDEIERLRAERDAIDALHQPDAAPEHDPQCTACRRFWPCQTHRLLHPEWE